MTKFGWQSLAWLLAIVAFAIWMAATTDQGRRRDRLGQPAQCNVEVGGYDDAALTAYEAVRSLDP